MVKETLQMSSYKNKCGWYSTTQSSFHGFYECVDIEGDTIYVTHIGKDKPNYPDTLFIGLVEKIGKKYPPMQVNNEKLHQEFICAILK